MELISPRYGVRFLLLLVIFSITKENRQRSWYFGSIEHHRWIPMKKVYISEVEIDFRNSQYFIRRIQGLWRNIHIRIERIKLNSFHVCYLATEIRKESEIKLKLNINDLPRFSNSIETIQTSFLTVMELEDLVSSGTNYDPNKMYGVRGYKLLSNFIVCPFDFGVVRSLISYTASNN